MDTLTIDIDAGTGYEVMVGPELLQRCGDIAARLVGPRRVAVITDETVEKLYLDPVVRSLTGAGFRVCTFSFPAGEGSKNIGTLSAILEFLAEEGLTRSDCLAALGGGVVGDLAGFAAGCYLRGIRYLQLPTTLLAAVDSSVGGKTAVNLRGGKNMAGLFLQPAAVLCDTGCLATLPPPVLADGLAEAIKTGILSGEELFSLLEGDAAGRLSEIIALSVRFKGDIVKADDAPIPRHVQPFIAAGQQNAHSSAVVVAEQGRDIRPDQAPGGVLPCVHIPMGLGHIGGHNLDPVASENDTGVGQRIAGKLAELVVGKIFNLKLVGGAGQAGHCGRDFYRHRQCGHQCGFNCAKHSP